MVISKSEQVSNSSHYFLDLIFSRIQLILANIGLSLNQSSMLILLSCHERKEEVPRKLDK